MSVRLLLLIFSENSNILRNFAISKKVKMKKLWLWLIIVVVAAGAVAGIFVLRGQSDNGADSAEAIAERLWNFSQFRPDGFTIDVRTLEQPDEGIAVAYAATQGCHSRESLVFVVTHALQHDGYVGGWLDRDSGLYYFDSTRLFPENQLEEALQFARENGQLAVYVISTGEEYDVCRSSMRRS